jgi:hypothetical protein
MRYVANPVQVLAKAIKAVDPSGPCPTGVFRLTLEDGTEFRPDAGMLARMTPRVGDYLVTQQDGYIYLNPKDVFERKYRPLKKNEEAAWQPAAPK